MSNIIDLKKGLNIPISGVAALEAKKTIVPDTVAIKPTDFKGLSPRLLVKEGDKVLAGSPVLADKQHQDILLTSPVSGTVAEIVRGEKRKLLAVLVKADGSNEAVDFGAKNPSGMKAEEVKETLLKSGLWPFIIQNLHLLCTGLFKYPVSKSCKTQYIDIHDTVSRMHTDQILLRLHCELFRYEHYEILQWVFF